MLKSTNGDGNWSGVNTDLINLHVDALAIDPATPAILCAGTHGGGVFDMQQVVYRRYLPLILRS